MGITAEQIIRTVRAAASLAVAFVAVAAGLAAQQAPIAARPDTAGEPRGPSASLSVDANNSGTGTWMQITPSVGYAFGPRWSMLASLPFYHFNAASSVDGTTPASGLGDALATLTLDLSSDTTTFTVAASLSAATGDAAKGFGVGKAGWDISAYLSHAFGHLSPYATAGVSDNATLAGQAQTSGTGAGRLIPASPSGNLVHGEAGIDVDVGGLAWLSGSAYAVSAPATTQTIRRPATTGGQLPRRGPRGRIPTAGSGVNTTTVVVTDDVSDSGIGASVWAQFNDTLDAGIWVSHSLRYSDFNTVSVSVNLTWSAIVRRPRPR